MTPPVRITIKPLGTIHVEGPVEVVDHQGNPLTPPPSKVEGVIKFCGCGHSATRPFCDGSHKKCAPAEPGGS
jgi:CDGSH-type Zn-finger protein